MTSRDDEDRRRRQQWDNGAAQDRGPGGADRGGWGSPQGNAWRGAGADYAPRGGSEFGSSSGYGGYGGENHGYGRGGTPDYRQGSPNSWGRGEWAGEFGDAAAADYAGSQDGARGSRGQGGFGYGAGQGSYGGPGQWGRGEYGGEYGRGQPQHDPDYLQWREEQIRKLDSEYQSWREERYRRFSEDFNSWRAARSGGQGQNASSLTTGTGAGHERPDRQAMGGASSGGSDFGSTGQSGSGSLQGAAESVTGRPADATGPGRKSP